MWTANPNGVNKLRLSARKRRRHANRITTTYDEKAAFHFWPEWINFTSLAHRSSDNLDVNVPTKSWDTFDGNTVTALWTIRAAFRVLNDTTRSETTFGH